MMETKSESSEGKQVYLYKTTICVMAISIIATFIVLITHSWPQAQTIPTVTATTTGQTLTCLDENGRSVDWFIAYKFPQLSEHSYPFNTGFAYSYITNDTRDEGDQIVNLYDETDSNTSEDLTSEHQWYVSEKLINDTDSPILRTLSVAYGGDNDVVSNRISVILYNDGPPSQSLRHRQTQNRRSDSAKAHSKGVLMMDQTSGDAVWLTHSTPQFPPPLDQEPKFLENSHVNGQTFMCMSFRLIDFGNQIVQHLITMNPLVYEHRISDEILKQLPDIKYLVNKRRRSKRPSQKSNELSQVMKTKNGQKLNLFSKANTYGMDLYSIWMEHALNDTFYVQSWRRGAGGELNSFCPRNDYHINNIEEMKVSFEGDEDTVSWSYLQDHSKWAISEHKENSFVCISDINRMRSQFKRGGGAVCFKCSTCWSTFLNMIQGLEPCPSLRRLQRIDERILDEDLERGQQSSTTK